MYVCEEMIIGNCKYYIQGTCKGQDMYSLWET